jgi:hypothetical protein
MTTRADLIEAAARALFWDRYPDATEDDFEYSRIDYDGHARAVLDVVLPQITTVEQLEALPEGAALSFDGLGFGMLLRVSRGELRNDTWTGSFEQATAELGPLTVVWQPSVDRVTT